MSTHISEELVGKINRYPDSGMNTQISDEQIMEMSAELMIGAGIVILPSQSLNGTLISDRSIHSHIS